MKPFDTHKPRGSIDATAKKVDWQTDRILISPVKSRDNLVADNDNNKPRTYRVSSQENTNMHEGMQG